MPKAIWEGAVLADSDRTVEVEGNQYFPLDSIVCEFFHPNDQHTVCPWKGTASYFDLVVNVRRMRAPPGTIRSLNRPPNRSKIT